MDGHRDYHLSQVSQTEKGKYHVVSHVESNFKMIQTYLQNRNRLTEFENKLMVTKGHRWGKGQNESLRWASARCVWKGWPTGA